MYLRKYLQLWIFLFSISFLINAGADPFLGDRLPWRSDQAIPEPVRPWVAWLESQHPELACTLQGEVPACIWPTALHLSAHTKGAHFSMSAKIETESTLLLPGTEGIWPEEVQLLRQGLQSAGTVLIRDRRPVLLLAAGDYQISGLFRWAEMPTALPVPKDVALVTLAIDGKNIEKLQFDDAHALWLGKLNSANNAPEKDTLEIRSFRKFVDDTPFKIFTYLELRVTGHIRDVSIPAWTIAGTLPAQLTSSQPARIADNGDLIVRVSPGTNVVQVLSIMGSVPEVF